MQEQETTHPEPQDPAPQTQAQETEREWQEPVFEQKNLKEALTGSPNPVAFDGSFYYS